MWSRERTSLVCNVSVLTASMFALRVALVIALVLVVAVGALGATAANGQADDRAKPARPRFVPSSRSAERVGVITIRGPIDSMTLQTVQRRMERALKDGCNGVVIELDTPGGELGATLAICHLLKTSPPTNKVAWIRPQAFSAGAIIALTCREIIVSDASSIGDAAPIMILPGTGLQPLPAAERSKFEAPILSEVTDSALRNRYDVRLVRAFVHVDDELWLVQRDDGRRLFVNAQEFRILFDDEPTRSAGPRYVPDEAVVPENASPAPLDEDSGPVDARGMGDALRIGDAIDIELEQFVLEPRVTPAERGRWTLLGQVDSADQLVTLRGEEAVRYGLASARINSDAEVLDFFGASSLTRYDESWSESLVRLLISWPARGFLMVVLLLCFFLEMITPGVGVFGAIATFAFLILIGAPALAGLAEWWEILLVVVGFGLIAVEVLLTPGFGVAGVLGALCVLVGLVFTFVGGDLRTAQSQNDLIIGVVAVLGAFVVALLGVGVIMRRMHTSPFFRKFVLERAVGDTPALAVVGLGPAMPANGALGAAITDLRPAGRVAIADAVFDVRTTGAWIARGASVRVVDRDGLGLVVEQDDP